MENKGATKVDAADYSEVSSGFSKGADGSVSASFTVTKDGFTFESVNGKESDYQRMCETEKFVGWLYRNC